MKFKIESWTIEKLIDTYTSKSLNLNPPYQRNNIWTEKAQMKLISSIKDGMPLPTFFFHEIEEKQYEIADGQQRTRAILAFYNKEITDFEKKHFVKDTDLIFLNYKIPVVVIDQSVSPEKIRDFYKMVNNSGIRVNQPESRKAEFFDTDILKLVEELTTTNAFKEVNIFNDKQKDRMIDREFVEELVSQIFFDIGDKKNDIKKLYSQSFEPSQINECKSNFNKVLSIITSAEKFEIANTRYSQRNDFYTLFGFVLKNLKLSQSSFDIFFEILLKIENDISPSNFDGGALQFYAFNCVSQTNSKQARLSRLNFFNELFLNIDKIPNETQKEILEYYKLKSSDLCIVENKYLTINPKHISTQFNK